MSTARTHSTLLTRICERYKFWYALLVMLLVSIIYLPTLQFGYNVDDYLVVENNQMVQSGFEGIPALLTSYYQDIDGDRFEWRPITKITYAIEHELFGENPRISHGVNLVLYFVVLVFIWLTLQSIVEGKNKQLLISGALVVFAVHPLHVEVVASLKNREVLLSCLFGLGAMVLLFKDVRDKWYSPRSILAFFLFFLSLATKVSGMVYFLIIPLVYLLVVEKGILETVKASSPLAIPFSIYTVIFLVFFPDSFNRAYGQPFYESHLAYIESSTSYYATAFYTLAYNCKLMVTGYPLSFFYGYSEIGINSWAEIGPWVGVSLFFFLAAALLLPDKRLRLAMVFIVPTYLLFSNLLLPVPGAVADRILFLPVLGFGLLITHLCVKLQSVFSHHIAKLLIGVISIAIVGYYTAQSVTRTRLWKDKLTLVQADLKNYPNSAVGHAMLAKLWMGKAEQSLAPSEKRECLEMSISEWMRFVEIDPSMGNIIHFQIGSIYHFHLKDFGKAVEHYQKSIKQWNMNKQGIDRVQVLPIHQVEPDTLINRIQMISGAR